MTNIDVMFFDSAVALKLALSLGHFLWQGTLIGLLACAAGCIARHRSQWQYAVHVTALVLMAVCLPVNLQWVSGSAGATTASMTRPGQGADAAQPSGGEPVVRVEEFGESEVPIETARTGLPAGTVPVEGSTQQAATEPGRSVVTESAGSLTDVSIAGRDAIPASVVDATSRALRASVTARLAGLAPSLVLAWLLGVAALFLRLLLATSRGFELRREATPVADSVFNVAQKLARQLGIRREVFVGCCESIAVPVAVGILRPAILFPSAVLMGLTPNQVELVLLHELSHFRRRDHLVVVLQRLVETLLFFHPAVWIVSRQVSLQREHCCDADVVSSGAAPVAYASCLLRIAELQSERKSVHAVTLASDGHRPSQLRSRVSRILGMPDPAQGRFPLSGIFALAILLGGCLWSLTHETAVAETGVVESGDTPRTDVRDEKQPTPIPEVVSVRLTVEDANGGTVEVSQTSIEHASRGYVNANSDPVSMRDGALRLQPGSQMLAFRQDSRGEAMLIELDVPPRDSSKTVQLRKRAAWAGNEQVQLNLEAQVYEREFGNSITVKFRNTGQEDFTLVRPDIQFVTSRWRIIPVEASHLDGFTLTRDRGEYSHGFSWSNAVRNGIWIPRNHEEITEDLPEPEPGKIWLGLQIGPTLHPDLLKVEDPDVVIARDERYRRDGKVSVELDKQDFVLGENVLLHYSVTNQGEEPLRISVGSDYRGSPRALRFKVHAYDEAGKRLADPHPNPWNMGGLGVSPELKPGETYWLSIPLMDYVQLEKPGTYRVRVFHDLGWNERSDIPDTIDNSMPKSETVAPIVETTISILEPSPDDAQTVLNQATKPRPETSWGQRARPHGAWSALRYPVYLPLLLKVADQYDQAIGTIASIATPEATDALIRLAEDGSAIAASWLPVRLPHPNFKQREYWTEAWSVREKFVRNSWRNEYSERVRQIAWRLLEAPESEPYEERKNNWMLGGTILMNVGRAEDFPRFVAAANPIVESLGTVVAEQQQYPAPPTVIANFFSAGGQLIHRGARPGTKPQTAFEAMMFMTAIGATTDFRPGGWQTLARRLMRHSMPRVRSTCVGSLPRPFEQQFVEPVIALFDDSSPVVAGTALLSAGAAKDERFLEAALKVSREAEDQWVRGAANHAAANCRPAEESQPVRVKSTSTSTNHSSAVPRNLLKVKVAAKQAELARRKQLFRRGFVAQSEVEKLELELATLVETLAAEEATQKLAGDSADDTGNAAVDPVAKVLSKVPWSKPLNGLRIRIATPATGYRPGDRLPLHAQLQNVTENPIPFSKLSRQVRVRVNDEAGEWVGIARDDFDISPWEARTGELQPDEIIQWTMQLERRRFNKAIKPGATLTIDVGVPSQVIEPGKLPRTEYSQPVQVRFDQAPDSDLRGTDFKGTWSRETTLVYREVGGLFAPSRALRIDGSGMCTAVRPKSLNPPEKPLLPVGRTTVQLPAERLNRISSLLSEVDLNTLAATARIPRPDEPEFLLTLSIGGRTLSGSFPSQVVQDSPDLTAIQHELREVMNLVRRSARESAALNDPLTKQRRRKLLNKADSFHFQLYYYGDPDEPFYALDLQTRPTEANNFFLRSHQLSRKQIETLIDGLAGGQFLRNGLAERPPNLTYKEGYVLYLSCQDYMQYEVLGFPDNKDMVARLIGLHSSLAGEAARSMSLLLGRMGVPPEDLPDTTPAKRVPIPKEVRLRVYQGNPSAGDTVKPIIDRTIATEKPFDLKSESGITATGKLFEAVTGRPRFKATVRHNGGTNEFDAEISLGKPLRSYGGGFASGILEFSVQLDPVE